MLGFAFLAVFLICHWFIRQIAHGRCSYIQVYLEALPPPVVLLVSIHGLGDLSNPFSLGICKEGGVAATGMFCGAVINPQKLDCLHYKVYTISQLKLSQHRGFLTGFASLSMQVAWTNIRFSCSSVRQAWVTGSWSYLRGSSLHPNFGRASR